MKDNEKIDMFMKTIDLVFLKHQAQHDFLIKSSLYEQIVYLTKKKEIIDSRKTIFKISRRNKAKKLQKIDDEISALAREIEAREQKFGNEYQEFQKRYDQE